jgi:hypothetical protein
MFSKDQLKEVHPDYSANIERYRFYADSYQGGTEYLNGEYLFPYVLETGNEYHQRVKETPLENHCKRTVDSYSSFIFGSNIERDYGSIDNNPNLDSFLADADLDGRSFNAFLREASKWSSVYGCVFISVDKPESNAQTRAEELGQGIRPYISLLSPENVIDWQYQRQANGHMVMTYLKAIEEKTRDYTCYVVYTRESTVRVKTYEDSDTIEFITETPNTIGEIPIVVLYNNRSWKHAVGISDIADVADLNRSIYTDYSEINQLIKLSNHPTLVKTQSTEASAGAGAIITMDENLDSGLKPYLLTPSGTNISTLLDTIDRKVVAIEKMTHLDSVSGQKTARSGVAMMIEQKALNSLLADKAANLALAEEQIWRLWCLWEGTAWDGEVVYPDSFDTRDRTQDLMNLKLAMEIGVSNPELAKVVQAGIARALVEDADSLVDLLDNIYGDVLTHDTTTPLTRTAHIQEMIMDGLSDQQMLNLHPEITQEDIDSAKQELLDSNNEGDNGST